MTDLIQRIEAAKEPSVGLFEDVYEAVFGNRPGLEYRQPGGERGTAFLAMLDAQAWTSAAEMLVPDGWDWLVRNDPVGGFANLTDKDYAQAVWNDDEGRIRMAQICGRARRATAAHPGLALLAAILRAERKDDE